MKVARTTYTLLFNLLPPLCLIGLVGVYQNLLLVRIFERDWLLHLTNSPSHYFFYNAIPPLGGWSDSPLVALGCHTLAPVIPGFPLTGSSVSVGRCFLSTLTALPLPAWRLSSVLRTMSLFCPFHILHAEFCLQDICQDQKRLPPVGESRESLIHNLPRATSSPHIVPIKPTEVFRLKTHLSLHVRLYVCQLINRVRSTGVDKSHVQKW